MALNDTTKVKEIADPPRDWIVVDEVDGVLDELQAWYLGKVEREGWVYTGALRQLVNRMYRDRDFLARRSKQGRRTAYDYAVERDQKALAWAIRAIVRYVPQQEKAKPEPPKPPRRPARRRSRLHGPKRTFLGPRSRAYELPRKSPSIACVVVGRDAS